MDKQDMISEELHTLLYNLPYHAKMSKMMIIETKNASHLFGYNNQEAITLVRKYESDIIKICGSVTMKRINKLIDQLYKDF